MPATYEPIATYTVTGTPTEYTFSSIPSTYTDLVLVCSFQNTTTANNGDIRLLMSFNGESGTSYSTSQMFGNGTTAYAGQSLSRGGIDNIFQSSSSSTSEPGIMVYHIMNYANTTVYKPVIQRQVTTSYQLNGHGSGMGAGQYRSTSAITSIRFYNRVSGELFTNGSTFTIYGIKAA